MEPSQLFERRELVRVLDIPAKYVQRNIKGSLLAQMSAHVEGKCGVEGYIQPKSPVILDYSLGKVDMLHSGVRYRVRFHADVCFPHRGQVFKAPVTLRSKIGIHAELPPMKILIPRDLHIGNEEFDAVEEGAEITFQVLGSEFKQNDSSIFVLGRLLSTGKPEEPVVQEEVAPVVSFAEEHAGSEEVKSINIKPEVKEAAAKKARRKRLGAPNTLDINVGPSKPSEEGAVEGKFGTANPV